MARNRQAIHYILLPHKVRCLINLSREHMKHFHYVLGLLTIMLLTGCIHTYPDGNAEDPTSVNLNLEMSFKIQWKDLLTSHNIRYYSTSTVEYENVEIQSETRDTETRHRFIIELRADGNSPFRHELSISQEEFDKGELYVKLPFSLPPLNYKLSVWSDSTGSLSSEPLPSEEYKFDASDFNNITPIIGFSNYSLVEDCCYCVATVDLREFRHTLSTSISVPVTLQSPVACFELIATDVEKFLKYADYALQKGEKYTVSLSYDHKIATTFNMLKGLPSGKMEIKGMESLLPPLFSKETSVGKGWIFVSEETEYLSVTLSLYNSARILVSRVKGILFPLERGKVTHVKGNFLTNFYSSSIHIDNLWNDEIVFTID